MSLDQQRQSNFQELPGTHRGWGRRPAYRYVRDREFKTMLEFP
jgi:hypothetical protein